MASVGSLSADLRLEAASFISKFNKAAEETRRNTSAMQRSLARLQRSIAATGSQFKTFIAGFVGIQGIRALANLGKAAIQTADEIGEAATKLGIAADVLQRFRFAAAQADVETGQLDAALKLFQRNLSTGKLAIVGKDITEQFQNFIKRIAEAPSQIDKVRIAQEGLGKQFQIGILLAAQGADEFKRQYDSAFVISEKALKAASDLDNEFRALSQAFQTGFATGFLEEFGTGLGSNRDQLNVLNRLAIDFGRNAAAAFKFVRDSVVSLTGAYRTLNEEWQKGNPVQVGRNLGEQIRRSFQSAPTPGSIGVSGSVGSGVGAIAGASAQVQKFAEANAKATAEIEASWRKGTKVFVEDLPAGLKELSSQMNQFGDMVASSFADAIFEGEKLSDTLGNLLKDLSKMALNSAFRALLGSAIGQPSAAGQAGSGFLGLFHSGGIVGKTPAPMRMLPAAALALAPRLHNGLMPDEFPAILQKGEAVLSKKMVDAGIGGGGGMTVNVNTTVDASGADPAAIARLEAALARRDAELPTKIVKVVSNHLRRNGSFR